MNLAVNERKALTVSQLNMYVKSLLESNDNLKNVMLVGEISNFKNHSSGHLYLSLKDDTGLIRAVMFRSAAARLNFCPKDGMKVVCTGQVSLYEATGQYQFYIRTMEKYGEGDLAAEFERLKEKLKAEGLFDIERKRSIPAVPNSVAVITSPTGAAVRDIMNILNRRFPVVKVIMCLVQVQGEAAAPQMIEAVKRVNELKCADTIIIGRGGGSIEDLWAFNDEMLARTVAASEIPVISGVGHETDFTLCDFAADLRAPTPSGAAELAVPEKTEILDRLSGTRSRLKRLIGAHYENLKLRFDALQNKTVLSDPYYMINMMRQRVDIADMKANSAFSDIVSRKKHNFTAIAAKIDSLSPMNVLKRGYSAIFNESGAVTSAKLLKSGDEITVNFSDGNVDAVVK